MEYNNFDSGEFQNEDQNFVNDNDNLENENNQKKNINTYQIERKKRINKTFRTITGYYYSSKTLNNTQNYIVNRLNDIKLDEGEEQNQKIEKKKKKKILKNHFFLKQKRENNFDKNDKGEK